jgi:hypothetical protein
MKALPRKKKKKRIIVEIVGRREVIGALSAYISVREHQKLKVVLNFRPLCDLNRKATFRSLNASLSDRLFPRHHANRTRGAYDHKNVVSDLHLRLSTERWLLLPLSSSIYYIYYYYY